MRTLYRVPTEYGEEITVILNTEFDQLKITVDGRETQSIHLEDAEELVGVLIRALSPHPNPEAFDDKCDQARTEANQRLFLKRILRKIERYLFAPPLGQ